MFMKIYFTLDDESKSEGAGVQIADLEPRRFMPGPDPGRNHPWGWEAALEAETHRL